MTYSNTLLMIGLYPDCHDGMLRIFCLENIRNISRLTYTKQIKFLATFLLADIYSSYPTESYPTKLLIYCLGR
ncbi:hypothetical protein X798_08150 [Onchocerca flexuosa]|uniref:Uncharacterized protein n=1 Tax=Onchocerca flexuosa TaxID=387005 RepID=A0A238BJP0_9BILA|nr:hypothetical protein X798_08150 [Onchocerca flexuosa]